MIKVLHVCKNFKEGEGGVERFVEGLSFCLKESEVESSVLTTTSKDKAHVGSLYGNKVYYFPRNFTVASCPFSFSLLQDFKRITKNYDIIHYHFPWPFMDLTALFTRVKNPSLITYHSDIVRQRIFKMGYEPIMRLFLKKSDVIVATSKNLLNSSPVLKSFKQKSIVIPIGLDRDQYPLLSTENMIFWQNKLKNLGLKNTKPFLFIGALRYYKGLDFLLEAIRNTNLFLLIVGDGPHEKTLKKLAREKNINNVHFLGHVNEEDKLSLIKLSKAIVSSSHLRSEAFCISLLEGLMLSKPLISTELKTGTSFVNLDGYSGIVVPPRDPDALRSAMQRLSTDDNLYEKFKKNAEVHYESYFRGDKMAEAYTEIYKTLIERKKVV